MVRSKGKGSYLGTGKRCSLFCGILLNFLLIAFAPGISGAATPQVSAGYAHSVALKSDGTVWAWGDNTDYQLGDGTNTDRTLPVQATGLTGMTAVAAGQNHTLALKSDGTVWAWGDNTFGQLGDDVNGIHVNYSPTPLLNPNLTGIIAIAAGTNFSMAVKSDGTVWTWGDDTHGQLGNGVSVGGGVFTPVQVIGLSGISKIAAGDYHALAMASDGSKVWAWGSNSNGQLGNGTTVDSATLVQVQLTNPSGVTITNVAAGAYHSFALKSDGTVAGWGKNIAYQLGDGNNIDSSVPLAVSSLTSVSGVSAGYSHSLALKSDGTLWAWGDNSSGELGNGTTTGSNTPTNVFSAATGCSGGFFYSLAIKSDGTVWAWGLNDAGQLGNGAVGTITDSNSTPSEVLNFSVSSSVLLGDMNNSGKVTAADALLVLQYSVGINTMGLTAADALARGDVNHSGKVTAADALLILQKSVGIASY